MAKSKRPKIKIPILKGKRSLYRYAGIFTGIFTFFQGCIWTLLSLIGTLCSFMYCGEDSAATSFSRCFYLIYYQNEYPSFPNLIKPSFFRAIMMLCTFMYILLAFISYYFTKVFYRWNNRKYIRIIAYIYTRTLVTISMVNVVIFLFFYVDFVKFDKSLRTCSLLVKPNLRNIPYPYELYILKNLNNTSLKQKTEIKNIVNVENDKSSTKSSKLEFPFYIDEDYIQSQSFYDLLKEHEDENITLPDLHHLRKKFNADGVSQNATKLRNSNLEFKRNNMNFLIYLRKQANIEYEDILNRDQYDDILNRDQYDFDLSIGSTKLPEFYKQYEEIIKKIYRKEKAEKTYGDISYFRKLSDMKKKKKKMEPHHLDYELNEYFGQLVTTKPKSKAARAKLTLTNDRPRSNFKVINHFSDLISTNKLKIVTTTDQPDINVNIKTTDENIALIEHFEDFMTTIATVDKKWDSSTMESISQISTKKQKEKNNSKKSKSSFISPSPIPPTERKEAPKFEPNRNDNTNKGKSSFTSPSPILPTKRKEAPKFEPYSNTNKKITLKTCEGNTFNLFCPKGKIKILKANYGRWSTKFCQYGYYYNTNCYSYLNATNIVKQRCEDLRSCSIFVNNALFGDPCDCCSKYLDVDLMCVTVEQTTKPTVKPVKLNPDVLLMGHENMESANTVIEMGREIQNDTTELKSHICFNCTAWTTSPNLLCMSLSVQMGIGWLINFISALVLIHLGKVAQLTPSLLLSPRF